DEVSIGEESKFSIKGSAFDNLLVSEFMGNIRATASQEDDKSDIRTQVYFESLGLVSTKNGTGASSNYADIGEVPEFEVSGAIRERAAPFEVENIPEAAP